MSNEVILTDANFETEVLKSPIPVLVDFWAAWCGPCRMIAPVIEGIANEYTGKIKVGKLNVDDNPKTSREYNVMSIPSILLFKDGKLVNQSVGVVPKEELISLFSKLL